MVKNLLPNAGDVSLIPGLGRSSQEGNGNPLQYSWLENPMDRGAWRAIVHGVSQSQTRLSNWYKHKLPYICYGPNVHAPIHMLKPDHQYDSI